MKTSRYPFDGPTPTPLLPQGIDQFKPFSTERLFTMQEAAQYLHVEPRTIGKFITDQKRTNKLRASWIGRRWIIGASSLAAFIAGQESE